MRASPRFMSVIDSIEINCIECNQLFEAHQITLLGTKRLISNMCPKCRVKKLNDFENQEKFQLEEQITKQKEHWLNTCGIRIRYKNKSFTDFKDRGDNTLKIKKICMEYAEKFPLVKGIDYHSLCLSSVDVWGNGKTHLVCSIAKRILERWASLPEESPVYYITEYDLFRQLRSIFNNRNPQKTEQELFEYLTTVPLLIVDDMGKEEVADPRFVQRVWFSIVNGRYDNMLPIVFTCNLDPDGVANHLGASRGNEATFDRLLEMTKGVFWQLGGSSCRRENI